MMKGMAAGGTGAINFLQTLDITINEIGDRYAEMTVTTDERHANDLGDAQAGASGRPMASACSGGGPG
jgi:acyl-coenzyme A thioesterase PaaI-like protein